MKQVDVKNKDGIIGWFARFDTQAQAEAWIAANKAAKSWGSPGEFTVEITDITDLVAREAANDEAVRYLAATDWYVIREMDSGIACPADIKAARTAARARINQA